jgi:hypothetical protein
MGVFPWGHGARDCLSSPSRVIDRAKKSRPSPGKGGRL